MAKGYVIVAETVRDPEGMAAYQQQAVRSMVGRTCRPLVTSEDPERLEGTWPGTRTLVLEFDSVEAAWDWYQSPEYQAAIPLRQAAADTSIILVEGVELPQG